MSKTKIEEQIGYRVSEVCYPVAGEHYQVWGYRIQKYYPDMEHINQKGFWFWKKEIKEFIKGEGWKDVYSYNKPVIFRTEKEAERFLSNLK